MTAANVAGTERCSIPKQVWWSRAATVGLHAALGAALYRRARATDLTSSAAITGCYMFIWKLFYAEYLLIPLLR